MALRLAMYHDINLANALAGIEPPREGLGMKGMPNRNAVYNGRPGRVYQLVGQQGWGGTGFVDQWWGMPVLETRLAVTASAPGMVRHPAFTGPARRGRVAVCVSGFYDQDDAGQWWYFSCGRQRPMFLAAVMNERGFAIVTWPAPTGMPRMARLPATVDAPDVRAWVDPQTRVRDALVLAAPGRLMSLSRWPVSNRIEDPGQDDPGLTSAVP